MTTNELTVPQGQDHGMSQLSVKSVQDAMKIAECAASMYKDDPKQIAAKIIRGMELGIPPLSSLEAIYTMERAGKVTVIVSSRALQAAVMRSNLCKALDIQHGVNEQGKKFVKVTVVRTSPAMTHTEVFTEDQVPSGKDESHVWRVHKKMMMQHRAVANCLRTAFPDLLYGMSIGIEGSEEVIEDEDAIDVTDTPAPEPEEAEVVEEAPVTKAEPVPVNKPADDGQVKRTPWE